MCQNCRLTCHKKCYQKAGGCSKISGSSSNLSPHTPTVESRLFGCSLAVLCAADGGVKIPIQIEQLITKIEIHGLYAEGLYRKSGVNSKIKELKAKMSENPNSTEMDFDCYNVHVLTNVLKSFLREMPEPLLTFDRYDDFLRAADLSDTSDRVQTLLSLIKKIPVTHHALLERLVFHLALVAQREQYNRMSASSLAIVFAPCVLRTNRIVPAQDSLNDISRQTKCMETLITQKMLNVKSTLADIDTLDTAAHTATTRLSTLRSSKIFSPEELASRQANMDSEAEETLLEGHIQEIQKEKALLTSTLPSLTRASSDDDLLSTDLDGEGGSLDDLSMGRDNYSMSDTKDSVDSTTFHGSSDTPLETSRDDQSSGRGGGGCSTVGVSYNLRDQNIGYIHGSSGSSNSRGQHQSLDHESCPSSRHVLPITGSADGYAFTTLQQNLHSSEQQQQRHKPMVMRSVSTGYDQQQVTGIATVTIGHPHLNTASGGGGAGLQLENQNSSASGSNNKQNINSRSSNSRKPKRQNSLDDEPIMV